MPPDRKVERYSITPQRLRWPNEPDLSGVKLIIKQEKGLGTPLIQAKLPSQEELSSEINCGACGGKCNLSHQEEEFPFRENGYTIRFGKVPSYDCGDCGVRGSPEDIGRKVSATLGFILRRTPEEVIEGFTPSTLASTIRSARPPA